MRQVTVTEPAVRPLLDPDVVDHRSRGVRVAALARRIARTREQEEPRPISRAARAAVEPVVHRAERSRLGLCRLVAEGRLSLPPVDRREARLQRCEIRAVERERVLLASAPFVARLGEDAGRVRCATNRVVVLRAPGRFDRLVEQVDRELRIGRVLHDPVVPARRLHDCTRDRVRIDGLRHSEHPGAEVPLSNRVERIDVRGTRVQLRARPELGHAVRAAREIADIRRVGLVRREPGSCARPMRSACSTPGHARPARSSRSGPARAPSSGSRGSSPAPACRHTRPRSRSSLRSGPGSRPRPRCTSRCTWCRRPWPSQWSARSS